MQFKAFSYKKHIKPFKKMYFYLIKQAMLSILIPTYNYNVVSLVNELHKQATKENITFEILVFDDGSNSILNKKNNTINALNNCLFKELKVNIGRSAIRNLLGKNAQYENLLFVDAGTFPKKKDFIKNYLNFKYGKIVVGGMTCLSEPPKKPYKLRWLYTKKRESQNNEKVICSSNFLIMKKLFKENPFDESIKKYGCEDVVFFNDLSQTYITYINNPVTHDAKDSANTFIKKTEDAIENLLFLLETKRLNLNHYNLSKLYFKIKPLKLDLILTYFFKLLKPMLLKNFNSSFPSLFLYDFYRLGYFCSLKTKQ